MITRALSALLLLSCSVVACAAADKAAPAAAIPAIELPKASAASCHLHGLAGAAITQIETDVLPVALSASSWTVAGGAGCDVRVGRVVVGALARYEVPVQADGSFLKSEAAWMGAARAGYLVTGNLLAYALAGYQFADLKLAGEGLDGKGLVLGGGLEVAISPALSLVAEYQRHGMSTLHPDPMLALEPVSHSMRLGVLWRFTPLNAD